MVGQRFEYKDNFVLLIAALRGMCIQPVCLFMRGMNIFYGFRVLQAAIQHH